ncbi:MAG: aldehyde dehydrogenase family protein, partial [Candidatus Nanopelagicales bacterium]
MTAVISPVSGAQIADVPATSMEETDAVIQRAHEAVPAWRAVSPTPIISSAKAAIEMDLQINY